MKFFLRIIIFGLGLLGNCPGQIWAEFQTTRGNFTISLDYQNSPLAVANFILLAGKPDDILETAAGVPFLETAAHYRQLYRPTAESDVQREALRVARIEQTQTMRGFYAIFKGDLYLGGVEGFAFPNYHADITGEDRIRLQRVSTDPAKYRITLRYPRNWLDARDLGIKESPMYRNLKINRVETGRRFFAGGMTPDLLEHPGYHFQDEIIRSYFNGNESPFNNAGVLAMDTLGPNRNGSRFFITSVAERTFNGKFTAFGYVADIPSLNLIRGIANTPTSGNQEPQEEMFITHISIRRAGQLANAYMVMYQQNFLPGLIEELPLAIEQSNAGIALVTPLRPQTQNALYSSSNLNTYLGGSIVGQSPLSMAPGRIDLTPLLSFAPRSFFRGYSASIPNWPSGEIDLQNARLVLAANSGIDRGTLTLNFGETGLSGSYAINMQVEQNPPGGDSVLVRSVGSGIFSATYDFSQGPYRGILSFTSSTGPLNTDELTLHFDSNSDTNNASVDPRQQIWRFDSRTTDPDTLILSYSGLFEKPL
ncbi:MAG: peptidyl-prolyl cis-trans isomerase A (cyclophilin A) [Akkermansiaceae bacterium]|jgi:peptidyl-prolyl cis-trans isomerase A (cyclophilin A)